MLRSDMTHTFHAAAGCRSAWATQVDLPFRNLRSPHSCVSRPSACHKHTLHIRFAFFRVGCQGPVR